MRIVFRGFEKYKLIPTCYGFIFYFIFKLQNMDIPSEILLFSLNSLTAFKNAGIPHMMPRDEFKMNWEAIQLLNFWNTISFLFSFILVYFLHQKA